MADKEERITIHQVLYPCKKCSIKCNKNDWKDCDFYQNYISGISRAEAVERIAKAIFQIDNVLALDISFYELAESKRKFYLDLAEASLDALLGEKK